MRTGLKRNRFITALAALLAVATLRAATLEDLERMCHAGRDEYTALRDAIVAEGKSALPFLDATLADETKPWKVRFMAGVCTDYIRHGAEIEEFLAKDWQKDPEYRPEWNQRITALGFPGELIPLFFKRAEELGTWYSFVEVPLGLGDRAYTNSIDQLIPEAAMGKMTGLPRLLFAKWEEERTRLYFEGKDISATSSPVILLRFATDGTYPEGADLLLAYPGRCSPEHLEALVQVTTNLAVLEELKTSKPDIVLSRSFKTRVAELRHRRDEAEAATKAARVEAEAAARVARAEAEAAARAARAEAEAAARAARAALVPLAVAAFANLLAALLLRRRRKLRMTNDE